MGQTRHHERSATTGRRHSTVPEAGLASTGPDIHTPFVTPDSAGPGARLSKIQNPPRRERLLSRPRLLDALAALTNNRLLLVTAGAGSGKTTLLADFTDYTRLRTFWYRLDSSDRNWRTFVERLILSIRQVDQGFGARTWELVTQGAAGEPSRELVMSTLMRELVAVTARGGALLILDDYQDVEDADEVAAVVLDLVAHAPDRFNVIISSRNEPSLPLARLRVLGEVSQITAKDLRFNDSETAALFRDVYHHPLDGDTAAELTRRTEGWPATLNLVEAAIRGRSDVDSRRFVRSLTGASGHLHDYLAEEVIGRLPAEQQQFLMRSSLLEELTTELSSAASGLSAENAVIYTRGAARGGLLNRSSNDRDGFRFHPLVRDFLQARLLGEVGAGVVRSIHLAIAETALGLDWAEALRHFAAAGEEDRAAEVLEGALGTILAQGSYDEAVRLSSVVRREEARAPLLVIASRAEFRAGRPSRAIELARSAAEMRPDSGLVLLNLMSLAFMTGDLATAGSVAQSLRSHASSDVAELALLYQHLLGISTDGSLGAFVEAFSASARTKHAEGQRHYEGICLVNAAVALRAMGRTTDALEAANAAMTALQSSSAGPELAAARLVRAWAYASTGDIALARAEASHAREEGGPASHSEICLEMADLEIWFGSETMAQAALDSLAPIADMAADHAEQRALCELALALRRGDTQGAVRRLASIRLGQPSTAAAMESRRLALRAHVALAAGDEEAVALLGDAVTQANKQEAHFWVEYTTTLSRLSGHPDEVRAILESGSLSPAFLAIHAETLINGSMDILDVQPEWPRNAVLSYPARWRDVLRRLLTTESSPKRLKMWAADLLDAVGERSDIPLLRKVAKSLPTPGGRRPYGKGLARRLAETVRIHDLNHVSLGIGSRTIPGTDVRRKALALMCFLVTRPSFAATRDEVIEALWPETDPTFAINSLNQTAYFLRRVLEPTFAEDQSPEYLRYQSDVMWLDPELVESDSAKIRTLLDKAAADPAPDLVSEISSSYTGKFALDFAYEDWTGDYRENLHAAYLALIEAQVRRDLENGHVLRGIRLAQRAIEIDPEAVDIELLLVRLYRMGGSHAAAAEQHSHYAAAMREDLDIEAPSIGGPVSG